MQLNDLLYAAVTTSPKNFGEFVNLIVAYISFLFPVVLGLISLTFVWGMVKFIGSAGNEESVKSGKQFMIWSIVIFFVVLSFWGMVTFLMDAFGFKDPITGDGRAFGVPQLPDCRTQPGKC